MYQLSSSFACQLSLESSKCSTQALNYTKRFTNDQIQNIFTGFPKDDITFLLRIICCLILRLSFLRTLDSLIISIMSLIWLGLYYYKIFDTRQFSFSLKIKDIWVYLRIPFRLFIDIFLDPMVTFLIIQRLK